MPFSHRHDLRVSLVLLALFAVGCGNTELQSQDVTTCTEVRKDRPIQANRNLDILMVIDDSPSMSEEATRLTANLDRFAKVLENIEGGLPNVHIAVVSSARGGPGLGTFESTARITGCEAPSGSFLVDIAFGNGESERNYSGTLGETLACIATLPPAGDAIEQPLEAMRQALNGSIPSNAGFLRDDAFLLILIISDEDDCSGGQSLHGDAAETNSAWTCFDESVQCQEPTDVPGSKSGCQPLESSTLTSIESYVDFLEGIKEDPGQFIVAAVSAVATVDVADSADGLTLLSTCQGTTTARPSVRLDAFRARFPQRNSSADICAEDWSEVLVPIAQPLTSTIGAMCISGDVDLDKSAEGIQSECVVSQIRGLGTDQQSESLLYECSTAQPDESEKPCWRIEDDLVDCSWMGQLELIVHRGRENVPSNTTLRALCSAGC